MLIKVPQKNFLQYFNLGLENDFIDQCKLINFRQECSYQGMLQLPIDWSQIVFGIWNNDKLQNLG